jgi:subtilisin
MRKNTHLHDGIGFISKNSSYILAGAFVILSFSSFVFSGSFSTIFLNVLAQSDDDKGLQSKIDDRITLSLENAKKLRQVAGERIPNHYIVVLKDRSVTSNDVPSLADEARTQGAVLRHVYEHSIRGFAIIVPTERALDAILRNPSVDYVQPDVKVKAFSQTLPTGVNRVDGDLSATKSNDGTGSVDVDIAVLDTGIDLSHPDLNVYKHTTFVSGTSTGNDDMGHGTSVAGITAAKDDSQGVVGIAPGARLWAVKVLDKNGQGFMSDIIAGIEYVTDNAGQIDVVNLSLGGDGPNDALHTAIINSVKAGVTYVASAGNAGVDAASTVPASFPEVITVSAIGDFDGKCGALSTMTLTFGGKVNRDDIFASFSNYGSVIDLAAPGENIATTQKGSAYRSDFSGTSASAPYVAGAAALYKSLHATATPSDIRTALRSSGATPSTVCDGNGYGYFKGDPDGIAEPFLYVGTSTDNTPPTVTSTIPAGGATGVAATSVIKATFSEKVMGTTVTTSTFILKNSAGASITGQVTSDGLTATFTPSSQLAFSTSYTATLSPSSTNSVKDLAGNPMALKSWSFTTAAAASQTTTSCGSNLAVSVTSSGSQNSFPPTNTIDNNLNTKWYSTFSVNPWIKANLGALKSVCGVDIAWADGATRQYSFIIAVSTDGTSFTNVFSGKSKGTTTSPERYNFAESQAQFVRTTITQSHSGSASSLAQISEIDIFGKSSTSAVSTIHPSSSSSQSNLTHSKGPFVNDNAENELADTQVTNHPPVAKDDRLRTEANNQIVATILDNDNDPDGDKLKIISVTSPTKKGGTVTINDNGTVTFLPASNIVGADTFSYTISDGKGKTDKAKVSISIKQVLDRTVDQTNHEMTSTKGEGGRNGEEHMQNQADRVHDNRDRIPQQVQEKAPTNANSSNSP